MNRRVIAAVCGGALLSSVLGFALAARAAEAEYSQADLLSTMSCVIRAQKYVTAVAISQVNVPRKDAVVALSVSKAPGQSAEEARREAEQMLDFALANKPLNGEKTGDEKFIACIKEKGVATSGNVEPACRQLLPVASEAMDSKKKGASKSQALKQLKDSKEVAALGKLEGKLEWTPLVERAYAWQRSPVEFSVGEVIKCVQAKR